MDEKNDARDSASLPEQKPERRKQPARKKKPQHARRDNKKKNQQPEMTLEEKKADSGKQETPAAQKQDETAAHGEHHLQQPHAEHTSQHTPHEAHPATHDAHEPHHSEHQTPTDGDEEKISPNYWKIAAVILGIALIITLLAQNMGQQGPFAPKTPTAPTQQGEDAKAPAQGAPQLTDTSNDPKVTLTVLNDPGCASCDTSQILSELTGQIFPKTTVRTVDVNSPQGQALAEKYEINAIPAYIYEKDVEDSANFERVAKAMLDKGDAYLIHPAATRAGKYLNPPGEDDDPMLGDKDAPVIIVEFSDFECPFCKRFHDETLPKIKEQYIRTGKVRFVYRDFPLPFHPDAQKTAEAAECADDQGQFWAYHDELFENQQALGTEKLKQYAQDLSLDMEEFNSCFDSGKHADEVKADLKDGANSGVSGTPTFFIGDELVSGAQPFSVFKTVIDAKLKE